jgi:hypothetical protein
MVSNILANYIETDQNFRCGIRVVIITQNKKDRQSGSQGLLPTPGPLRTV